MSVSISSVVGNDNNISIHAKAEFMRHRHLLCLSFAFLAIVSITFNYYGLAQFEDFIIRFLKVSLSFLEFCAI